jgi:hypothetical protein
MPVHLYMPRNTHTYIHIRTYMWSFANLRSSLLPETANGETRAGAVCQEVSALHVRRSLP